MKHTQFLTLFILLLGFACGLVAATTPCLTFDGSNDYVTLGNPVTLQVSNITLEFKAYLNSFASRPHILGRGGASDGAMVYCG